MPSVRKSYDEELLQLDTLLARMGHEAGAAIESALTALRNDDIELARSVVARDSQIDASEHEIEHRCLQLLLRQQPVASDLRQISAALKMITDMERIGDQAEDIAEIIGFLNGRSGEECAFVGHMARAAISMVTGSVDAYVRRDVALAHEVIARDDVVDEDFRKVKATLIDWIAQRPDDGEYALDLLMIAKYFERIGDHAANIAGWVVFAVTGVHDGEENGHDLVCGG